MPPNNNPFSQLPSVSDVLQRFDQTDFSHDRIVAVARQVLDTVRSEIKAGHAIQSPDEVLSRIEDQLLLEHQLTLTHVINATGVIIHTNLGRAPLSQQSQQAMLDVANGYSTLEYDLGSGGRGHRDSHIESLIKDVTGAEAALVVNNNAAAVYLVLSALAQHQEMIVSRGELVEIGGGFRIPDVMRQSGTQLVEVGTTNKTRLSDFEHAITDQTCGFMRIHSSNFKVVGFTEQPNMSEMATLAHEHNLILIDDIGSGALLETSHFGLEPEPTVQESLASGTDLVLFSGDKLLGGPQAGIIVGRSDLIASLRRFPLTRALRPDKLCLAALAATLRHYRDHNPLQTIPVWQMISCSLPDIEAKAREWQSILGGKVIDGLSTIGGGSLPGETLATKLLSFKASSPNQFAKILRLNDQPVIVRVQDDKILIDPRTVLPHQEELLIQSLRIALG